MPIKNQFRVRVQADWACFTRPEFKSERVSYDMMTPSVARNLLQSIFWKPEMEWVVTSISLLAPIRWMNLMRNEVKTKMAQSVIFIDADGIRTQRNTLALRHVDYLIEAHVELTERANDSIDKYLEISLNRLENGRYFQKPWVGCREMTADVSLERGYPTPIQTTRSLGLMHYDFDYSYACPRPLLFQAELVRGIMQVPPMADILAWNYRGAR